MLEGKRAVFTVKDDKMQTDSVEFLGVVAGESLAGQECGESVTVRSTFRRHDELRNVDRRRGRLRAIDRNPLRQRSRLVRRDFHRRIEKEFVAESLFRYSKRKIRGRTCS